MLIIRTIEINTDKYIISLSDTKSLKNNLKIITKYLALGVAKLLKNHQFDEYF
jgi:hypothetical protein